VLELLLVAEAELDSAVGEANLLVVIVTSEVEARLLVLVGKALGALSGEALERLLLGGQVRRALAEAVVQEGGSVRARVEEREERLLALWTRMSTCQLSS
jgi:hypothetical protein